MKQLVEKQYIKDALVIIAMIAFYNLYNSIAYDTIQFLNIRKVIFSIIGGFFYFVPMYAILWLTLRKIKSKSWFFIVSLSVWAIEPILMAQNTSDTFNAWQGKSQIFKDGQLTAHGYFQWLQNPFFLLFVYATIILASHLYRNFQHQNGGFKR